MKRVLIGIAVAVILGGGLIAALVLRPLEPSSPHTTPVNETPAEDEMETKSVGRYATYSEQAVSAQGYTETILFFHAGWCPECRAFEREIKSGELPDGVQILKVNYDTASELKQRHAVTLQSTFVKVNDEGKQISKWAGYGKDKSITAILENT